MTEEIDIRGHTAPELSIALALEDSPIVRLIAYTCDDEARLRMWLSNAGTRCRLIAAVEYALDRLDEEAAA